MKPARCIAPLLALVLALAGCASVPPAVVALRASPVSALAQPLEYHGLPTVTLRTVTLPGYLDSYAMVIGRHADTLIVAEDTEWAERLRDGASRVLSDALSQRLGASRLLMRGEHRLPDAELVIEFLKLDPVDGALQLDARWSFVCLARKAPVHAGRTQLQVPLNTATASGVAAATTNALAEFADVLAAQRWCDTETAT